MASLLPLATLRQYAFSLDPLIDQIQHARREDAQPLVAEAGVCKFFAKGMCSRGDACSFKHARTTSATVCRHWVRGLCKKATGCSALHEYDLSRMEQCHFLQTYGECTDPDCLFVHTRKVDAQIECPAYERGFCPDGPTCRNRHTYKPVCPDYLAGLCVRGPECTLGHPKWEIDAQKRAAAAIAAANAAAAAAAAAAGVGGGAGGGGFGFDQQQGRFGGYAGGGGGMGGGGGAGGMISRVFVCRRCDQPGHKVAECPTLTPEERERERRRLADKVCFRCNQKGHMADMCPNPRVPGMMGNAGAGGGGAGSGAAGGNFVRRQGPM